MEVLSPYANMHIFGTKIIMITFASNNAFRFAIWTIYLT